MRDFEDLLDDNAEGFESEEELTPEQEPEQEIEVPDPEPESEMEVPDPEKEEEIEEPTQEDEPDSSPFNERGGIAEGDDGVCSESEVDNTPEEDVIMYTEENSAQEDDVAEAEDLGPDPDFESVVPEAINPESETKTEEESVREDEIIEEIAAEEDVTENVIEEVKEKVSRSRAKPAPAKHDTAAEKQNGNGSGEDGIILKNIDTVMHDSMIPYSEFVIMDRALPRVEDGLKPVQRRILYAMNDMGLHPDKPFRKSAGIVGECLGKYHPHGDTSVYDAMVRLAQPFNMNMTLIQGQGNFGSDDGDPPAAMRYTEAKLSPLALELLRDIDKETVPFSLTFDDRNTEPDILPGRYPNLLTNGATGIAVGLATNIPPHNLGEVIDAHVAFIDNPKMTLGQAMKIIRGPDFPTGGYVICGEDLTRAYKEGKGKVIMRAKVHIEIESNDRRNIVITELPYQVNKVTLQKNIADLREQKKGILSGISEIRDESDRKGMRVVIKIKREFDAKAICELLFKHTNLQCNYNINMVAIAAGKPKLMGLMEFIRYYVEYQREIIYKRSVYDLENARERAHILEGLMIAIKNIDKVVQIIKTSKHTTEARDRLREAFKLSEKQAQAILDLRLARLTSLEVYKLEQELKELKELIARLEKIIASKQLQFDVVKQELLEIKRKYRIERRSRIIADLADATVTADDDPRAVEETVVTLTAAATIKRMTAKHFSMSKTEFSAALGSYDVNKVVIQTQTDKLLYVFTNMGNCYKIDVGEIPECKLRDKGTPLKELFPSAVDKERPIGVYAIVPEAPFEGELVWLSRLGMIKRSTWADACSIQKSAFQCFKLREDKPDEVMRVDEFKQGRTIMLISGQGYILNAMTGDVPLQGRIAGGVKGISMADNDFAVCNSVAKPVGFVVAVTNKGNVKRVESKSIEKMVRYRKGLQLGGALEKDERVIYGSWVKGDEDLVIRTQDDKGQTAIHFIPISDIPLSDRTAKWRPLLKIGKTKAVAGYIHRRKKNN